MTSSLSLSDLIKSNQEPAQINLCVNPINLSQENTFKELNNNKFNQIMSECCSHLIFSDQEMAQLSFTHIKSHQEIKLIDPYLLIPNPFRKQFVSYFLYIYPIRSGNDSDFVVLDCFKKQIVFTHLHSFLILSRIESDQCVSNLLKKQLGSVSIDLIQETHQINTCQIGSRNGSNQFASNLVYSRNNSNWLYSSYFKICLRSNPLISYQEITQITTHYNRSNQETIQVKLRCVESGNILSRFMPLQVYSRNGSFCLDLYPSISS